MDGKSVRRRTWRCNTSAMRPVWTPGAWREELSRLESEGFLTARQVRAVNRAWIASFFQTELGRRLQTGIDVLREFKFSLLADGEMLQEELAGESCCCRAWWIAA